MIHSGNSIRYNATPFTKGKQFHILVWLTFLVTLIIFSPIILSADQTERVQRDTLFFSTPPSAKELAEHLFSTPQEFSASRGITFTDTEEEASAEKSVGLPVLFHFGKTTIVEESLVFLKAVGEMMTSAEYSDRVIIVEGHTDAVGAAAYNQRLSELRALAIRDYLVTQYQISPLRLFPTGKGESLLYNQENPNDGINRRVEFLPFENS